MSRTNVLEPSVSPKKRIIPIHPAAVNRTQMAKDLEIDIAHFSRIFTGKSNPSMKLAKRICEWLSDPKNNPANPKGVEIGLDDLSAVLEDIKAGVYCGMYDNEPRTVAR